MLVCAARGIEPGLGRLRPLNRTDATAKTRRAVSEVLTRQGYVSAIDVLLHVGMLDKADCENWRMGRVPYLEKVVRGSLGKVSTVVRAMRTACREYGLQEERSAGSSPMVAPVLGSGP